MDDMGQISLFHLHIDPFFHMPSVAIGSDTENEKEFQSNKKNSSLIRNFSSHGYNVK